MTWDNRTGPEELKGTVSGILFQNPDNGYTVLRLHCGRETHTVTGSLPGISVGEELTVTGQWTNHYSYGRQFKAATFSRELPSSERAIEDYLGSGVIKGVGKRTAQRLVALFGDETLSVIESAPERLLELKGMTLKRAQAIQEEFLQKAGMRRLLEFLGSHGLPATLCAPLWRQYGEVALDAVKSNPYLLCSEDLGLKFQQADQLAAALGVDAADPIRIDAGLLCTLNRSLGSGHCFLPRDKLLSAAEKLLLRPEDELAAGLDRLCQTGQLVVISVEEVNAVYRSDLYEAECYIAWRLTEMSRQSALPPEGIDQLIRQVEREQGISYAPQQRQAVELASSCQVILLTGGPGTGKTTSLRGILGLFEAMGFSCALAAPTGRAAKRLSELTGAEAATIHRLLEAGYDNATGQLAFSKNESDPLEVDAVIVDEASMVDVPLMYALLAALKNDCRLVLVGDRDQLPSVGPGLLFDHLLCSGILPTVRLTDIFRQAQQSAIVMNAHQVNLGWPPDLTNHASDFFFLRRRQADRALDTIVELCKTRLPEHMGIPAGQIQVLSPTRKGTTGTANLNAALQFALNPPAPEKAERKFGSIIFRTGDRVIQVKNNYDILWEGEDGSGGMGVYNGDIGTITDIAPQGEVVTVDFDGRLVEYTPDMLPELELAYAMTVHKAQGSEYPAVILAALPGVPMLMTREVLYTAITRARQLLIIVGDEHAVNSMVQNDRKARRYSGIRFLLTETP